MSKRYDEIMEHIEVTPEMRQRILNNIQNTDLSENTHTRIIRFPYLKQFAAIAACFVLVLVGAMTMPNIFTNHNNPDVLVPGDGIVEVSTAEELSDRVGFEVTEWTDLPFHSEQVTYTAYWQEMAEIVYTGEGQTAVYRKGIGSDDVSGDYNIYEAETEIFVNNVTIVLKGNNGAYTLAIWTDGGFSYSLSLSEGKTESEWKNIF